LRELILNLHGLGEPHGSIDEQEKLYWWNTSSFACLLDQIMDRPINVSPQISITFDDGNASDALLALPELAKRHLKASFFVCAGRIGLMHYLDKSMIKDLLDAGMSIGSHGLHHRDWRILNSKKLDEEIVDARKIIEDISQTSVRIVALPFGGYNRRVLMRLNQEQWDCIYTSDRGTVRPTARIKPRETLYGDMQSRNFLSELTTKAPIGVRMTRALTKLYKRFA
jgi:peptidoglycan/xylan/chitin deacetylase (PgdA/CDA1 family)